MVFGIRLMNKLALAMVIVVFTACDREKPTWVDTEDGAEAVPDQQMWNSTVLATNKGRIEAKVTYGHMSRYSDKKIALFDGGIVVDFYNEAGEHSSHLTAESGELNEDTNDVRATGNVVVRSDSGVTLYTEEIAFDQKLDQINSNVDVMITTADNDTFYGVGFVSDPRLDSWKIREIHGIAHKGVDLSRERWKRDQSQQSDSLQVPAVAAAESVAESVAVAAAVAAAVAEGDSGRVQ
jgi:LPS export ABC transporter protein LptC